MAASHFFFYLRLFNVQWVRVDEQQNAAVHSSLIHFSQNLGFRYEGMDVNVNYQLFLTQFTHTRPTFLVVAELNDIYNIALKRCGAHPLRTH